MKMDQYKALIKEEPEFAFPCSLLCLPVYAKKFREASIIGLDEERIEVADYLLDRLFDTYIQVDDRAF